MPDLLQQLRQCLKGRVCVMGLGNPDFGDDGFGVLLAESLPASPAVLVAGASPERLIGQAADRRFDHLVFLDAVEFGGAPGSVTWLDSAAMQTRFPQVSTHKLSVGLLANWAESTGITKAWLLGVQPQSVKAGDGLSEPILRTSELLKSLLTEMTSEP